MSTINVLDQVMVEVVTELGHDIHNVATVEWIKHSGVLRVTEHKVDNAQTTYVYPVEAVATCEVVIDSTLTIEQQGAAFKRAIKAAEKVGL